MKNLKKTIRQSLIEVKNEKENRLVESKIISSRIKMILESTSDFKKFDKLSFERQWQIGLPLMQEIAKAKNYGEGQEIISEGGILNLLGSIFGTTFSSGAETIFESMLKKLFNKLGFTGFLADAVIFFFSRNPGKIWESFKDCNAFSRNISQAIMEAYIVKLQKEYNMGGMGMDFVRNALMETLENSDFGSKLADQFSGFVCGFFDTVKQKGTDIVGALNPKTAPVAAPTS